MTRGKQVVKNPLFNKEKFWVWRLYLLNTKSRYIQKICVHLLMSISSFSWGLYLNAIKSNTVEKTSFIVKFPDNYVCEKSSVLVFWSRFISLIELVWYKGRVVYYENKYFWLGWGIINENLVMSIIWKCSLFVCEVKRCCRILGSLQVVERDHTVNQNGSLNREYANHVRLNCRRWIFFAEHRRERC